jgi:hypothetical protein
VFGFPKKGEFNMKASGKVLEEKGRYFVETGKEKQELFPNAFGGVEAIKGLVGQEVEVFLSEPRVLAVVAHKLPPRFKCFLCYVPAPDLQDLWEIDPAIRQGLLKSFVDKGLVEPGIAEQQFKAS